MVAGAIRVHKVTNQYTKGDLVTMANISYGGTVVAEAIRVHKVTHQYTKGHLVTMATLAMLVLWWLMQ